MTNVEIEVKFKEVDNTLNNLEKEVYELQQVTKVINSLAYGINELAANMKAMLKEQERHSRRLASLEEKPYKSYLETKKVFATAIVSALGGGCAVRVIDLLSQLIK